MLVGPYKQLLGYFVAVAVIAAATGVLKMFGGHINPATVSLALLLIVLLVATAWGPKPAVLASLLGVTCINFFFIPPVGTLHIADPENWIALFAFLITAITVGQLSARARLRAKEANAARQEIERLYYELQETFEQASQAKALKQSERMKSALLDAVTHDLRTPLTSIKASVTTLLGSQPSEILKGSEPLETTVEREMLEVINEEADRLDRFIEGLMELAQIEAGAFQLRRHWGSLNEIIIAALKRAEPRTRRHRIKLMVDDELPPVNVDEPALAEVVYVLVDNAAKYSQPGSSINVVATSESNEIRIAVEDEGPGIAAELRERVFDKFFRINGSANERKPSGMGMGLAIAQAIVEAHGGRIWNENGAEGLGTRFIVALPIDVPRGSPVMELNGAANGR